MEKWLCGDCATTSEDPRQKTLGKLTLACGAGFIAEVMSGHITFLTEHGMLLLLEMHVLVSVKLKKIFSVFFITPFSEENG